MTKKNTSSRSSKWTRMLCLVLAGLMILTTLAAVLFR